MTNLVNLLFPLAFLGITSGELKTTPKNLPIFRYPKEQDLRDKMYGGEGFFKEGLGDSQEFGFFDGLYGDLSLDGQGQPFQEDRGSAKSAPSSTRDQQNTFENDYQSNSVDAGLPREFCPEQPEAKYYCTNLRDGAYFDPWNPWCGYIQCRAGVAHRRCCHSGTWMGLSTVSKQFSTKHMCRKPLPRSVTVSDEALCPEITDYAICKNAENQEGGAKENDTNASTA